MVVAAGKRKIVGHCLERERNSRVVFWGLETGPLSMLIIALKRAHTHTTITTTTTSYGSTIYEQKNAQIMKLNELL